MAPFRKKPVVIDAMRWPGPSYADISDQIAFEEWFDQAGGKGRYVGRYLHVLTLEDGPNGEAKHVADPGDWIVKGVHGEFYPVKPDIFAATYEPVVAFRNPLDEVWETSSRKPANNGLHAVLGVNR